MSRTGNGAVCIQDYFRNAVGQKPKSAPAGHGIEIGRTGKEQDDTGSRSRMPALSLAALSPTTSCSGPQKALENHVQPPFGPEFAPFLSRLN
jgi:hypothetical protein